MSDYETISILRSALKFYANKDNYRPGRSAKGVTSASPIEEEKGRRARAALDEYKESTTRPYDGW